MIAVAMEMGVVPKYVVEKPSGFGLGFRRVVLASGEVTYRCVKCPCVFSSLSNVQLHIGVCGRQAEKDSFEFGYIGWCEKADKKRVLVKNTIDNVLLCHGCRYFRLIDGRLCELEGA